MQVYVKPLEIKNAVIIVIGFTRLLLHCDLVFTCSQAYGFSTARTRSTLVKFLLYLLY